MALVQWTESVGLTLVGRDQSSMQLRTPGDQILNFTILQIFPFTYESKRMGIIVRVSPLLCATQQGQNPECAPSIPEARHAFSAPPKHLHHIVCCSNSQGNVMP